MAVPLPILAVTGVPRCGSSMMMRMLHAGGLDVVANLGHASYEDSRALELPDSFEWLLEARGKAVKLLDAHRFRPPTGYRYVFLLMKRNPHEQARSGYKLLQELGGLNPDPLAFSEVKRGIKADWRRMERMCRRLGPTLIVHFERVLADPIKQSARISSWLEPHGFRVLPFTMAAQVIDRDHKCLPYMLELEMASR